MPPPPPKRKKVKRILSPYLVQSGVDVEVLAADANDEVLSAAGRHFGVDLDVAERQLNVLRKQVVESSPGLSVERIGTTGRT